MSGENRDRSASRRRADRLPPRAGYARGRGRDAGERRGRGQTTLDFAIGVSVFLSVMLFVFAFVPGILQPFNLSGEEDIAMSERIASDLSMGTLGNASTPYVLESSCTVQFFETGTTPPSHCNYDGATLENRLAIDASTNLNVSLWGTLSGTDRTLVCWDGDDQDIEEVGSGECVNDADDQILAIGGQPPAANDATVTARRVVSLHQHNLTMKVVVW